MSPEAVSIVTVKVSASPVVMGVVKQQKSTSVAFVAQVDGRRRVRALVSFLDTPVAGQIVTVDEWSAAR